MVILYITDCAGDSGCLNATSKVLEANNVLTISNCADLNDWSVESLLVKTNLLSIIGCVDEQYDPTLNCYGQGFVCYDSWPQNSKDIPWSAFKKYVEKTTSFVPVTDGRFWMTQAHWQSTAESVIFGTLHNSSLLQDELLSGMNDWLVENVLNITTFPHLNFLEVDNVCHRGVDINHMLKERMSISVIHTLN